MAGSRYATHLAAAISAAWLLSEIPADARLDCSLTETGVVPLSDLAGTKSHGHAVVPEDCIQPADDKP